MLKKLLALSFLIPFMLFAQGQEPLVNIALNATDNAAGNFTVNIGIDPEATDGIDIMFDEAELPPPPPAGIFDTRLVIGTNTPVNKDFRQADGTSLVSFTHKIQWQLGEGGSGYKLSFTVPEGVTLLFMDAFGGVIVNQTFEAGPGEVNVTNAALTSLNITATYDLGGGVTVNAPSDLSAQAMVVGEVELNWSDNSDNETGFVLERETVTDAYEVVANLGADVTTYTDNSVANGTNYNYRVKAVANDVSSDYSNVASVTTLIPSTGDEVIIPLTVQDGGVGNIDMSFGLHPDATDGIDAALGEAELPPLPPAGVFDSRFILPGNSLASLVDYRTGDVNFTGSKSYVIKWQLGDGNTGYYLDFTVPANVEVNFQDPFGGVLVNETYGPGTHELSVTNDALTQLLITVQYGSTTVTVNAPSDLTALAEVVGAVELSWNDNSDNETGFVVEREMGVDAYEVIANLDPNTTSYTDETVAEFTTYNYRVKAVAGDVSSDYSNVANVTTLGNSIAPTNLTAEAVVVGSVNLAWSDNSDNESAFVVEREMAVEAYEVIATLDPNTSSYTDETVAEGTTYNYRVKAIVNNVSTDYSNVATVTTLTSPTGDEVVIPLTIQDGGVGNVQHSFGIHPDATDGIDAALGEAELPPLPPAGVFDSRFILPESTIGSLIDYRLGDVNYTGTKNYTLKWQLGEGATGLYLNFVVPANVSVTFSDAFGGVIVNETFGAGSHELTVTNAALTQLNIEVVFGSTVVTVNAPSELTAEAVAIGSVNLAWVDNSDNETGFVVEREMATEAYEEIATLDPNTTTYTDETVPEFTTYNYRIKAVAGDVSSDYSNVANVTTLGNTAPEFVNFIDQVTIPAGFEFTFQYTATDNENDDLTFTSDDLPSGATLVEGLFTWTPSLDQLDEHSFTVTVSDGLLSDEVTSIITVVEPVTMTAGDVEGLPGDMVYVPVNVTDFNGVGAVTLEMGYDDLALNFVSLANVNPMFNGALVNGSDGSIFISWVDNTLQGVNFGETKLFDLKFEYVSGQSAITFNAAGSEVSDVLGEVITVTYFDGSVSLAPIRLLTPNGGEELNAGDQYEITWVTNGFDMVNLTYSVDGGTSWETIVDNATGSDYMWTVPETPSDNVLVRVANSSDANVYDESDAVFSILPSTFMVTGIVTYDNSSNTPLAGVTVYLYQNENMVAETTSDADGNYTFTDVANGEYVVKASSENTWGGVNSTDALLIRRHVVQLITLEGLKLEAADVNASSSVNSTDALVVRRRVVQLITTFPAGDWAFESPAINMNGDDVVQDFAGICYGDVNGSYSPTLAKEAEFTAIQMAGKLDVNVNEEFEVPVVVKSATELGAVTFQFEYPRELAELTAVNFAGEGALYNDIDGKVTVAWADLEALKLNADDALMTLRFKPTAKFEAGSTLQLNLGSYTEFANAEGKITDPSVAAFSVEVVKPTDFSLRQNYPNPFNPSTTIEYDLPSKSNVMIEIYNTVGEKVAQLMDQEQKAGSYKVEWHAANVSSGIYFYRIYAKSENQTFVKTQKMILLK